MKRYKRLAEGKDLLSNKLSIKDYKIVKDFLNYYQEMSPSTTDIKKRISKIKPLLGLKDILYSSVNKKLYRGLFFDISEFPIEIAEKQQYIVLKDLNFSWTKSLKKAIEFAYGPYSDAPKLMNSDGVVLEYGVVIEYIPKQDEIFVDLQFIKKNYSDVKILYPSEQEVMCISKTKKFNIVKILK